MTGLEADFDKARKLYPGTKRGLVPEFENFRRKYRMKGAQFVPLMVPAIESQIAYRQACDRASMWCPEWPHFQTWINNQRWTDEMPKIKTNAKRIDKCQYCDAPATIRLDIKGARCSKPDCVNKFNGIEG